MALASIEKELVVAAADSVAKGRDADVILYNGPMLRPEDTKVISQCRQRNKRTHVLVILVTRGGDADAAYRMARCFQTQYTRFLLYVSGFCKSAGTLVAVGAHDLIMSDRGELGPLDVQMPKKDALWEMQSGLTVMDTLDTLQYKAARTFEQFFGSLVRSSSSITLKTAAEIATKMTTGLFAPLYSQVDPLHIGEAGRAMTVAEQYGNRLLEHGCNITDEGLRKIVTDYPSHGYVIDRAEATRLFESVQEPSTEEVLLVEALGDLALEPLRLPSSEPLLEFLSTELKPQEQEQTAQANQ